MLDKHKFLLKTGPVRLITRAKIELHIEMVSSSTCLAFLLLCYCANPARGAAGNTLEETVRD